eukprot:6456380-Amphidinium_carterae.1
MLEAGLKVLVLNTKRPQQVNDGDGLLVPHDGQDLRAHTAPSFPLRRRQLFDQGLQISQTLEAELDHLSWGGSC